jgi:hypothetical protein
MTGWKRDVALAFVFLHFLALFDYTLRWLWVAMLAIALLIHACASANAHSWYPHECCSDRDCYPLPAGAVKEVPGGYQLIENGEFIPHADTRNGQDDQFHICRWPDGRRICFFRPYSGT